MAGLALESRQRILDAAAEIAGERGYEGTSIAAVSAKCGLPASSIYWHFENKDNLIAAVIERSFETWLAEVELPDEGAPQRSVVSTNQHGTIMVVARIAASPTMLSRHMSA
ncbi:transcriptional regulator, TetR family [Streptomyces sp. Ag109_G2-15]|nr:transcriptional regulator, TetR family [Streptomyces sp. Ag109_G2-15]